MAEKKFDENELNDKDLANVSGGYSVTTYHCSKKGCSYKCDENTLPQGGICPKDGYFLVED